MPGSSAAARDDRCAGGNCANADDAAADLGTVEVIGTRVPTALLLTVDTLEAAEIAASHRDDLSQALEAMPGVALQNLGQRRERLLALRGFSSRQVPLFIDGVPVYVPYEGNVDLSRFGIDYVVEIAVSKGLSSLLYGPNILWGEWQPVDALRPAAAIDQLDRSNLSSPTIAPTNTPRHRYRAVANWQFTPQWKLRVDSQYEGRRISNTTATRIAGGFGVVNALARLTPAQRWGFDVGLRNATDKLYAYEDGFFEAGRTWVLQLDWRY